MHQLWTTACLLLAYVAHATSEHGDFQQAAAAAACPYSQAAAVPLGTVPSGAGFQVQISDGAFAPLQLEVAARSELRTDTDNNTAIVTCKDLHWGMAGGIHMHCDPGPSGAALVADTTACVRTGCIWHHYITDPTPTTYEVSYGAVVAGGGSSQLPKWTPAVLAGDGNLYAAPASASGFLRVDGSSGEATTLQTPTPAEDAPGSGITYGPLKYSATVLGGDGAVYAVPYSEGRVLRVDPATGDVSMFGALGNQDYKWSDAVMANDGRIYAVPSTASRALMIDPMQQSAQTMVSGDLGGGLFKWASAVLAPSGEIFGIPSDSTSVIRINPISQMVAIFGNLDAGRYKWANGLVGVDGTIYGIPSWASSVLRIFPNASRPVIDDALGAALIPEGGWKWQHGVASSDGRIFCIPRAATQVLMIDPRNSSVALLSQGNLSNAIWKWQYGIAAPNGFIYGIPADAEQVLRIDPATDGIELIGDVVLGERKFIGGALLPSGAVIGVPSFEDRLLQIAVPAHAEDLCIAIPLGLGNLTCTLGQECGMSLNKGISPSALRPGNLVWLVSPGGDCRSGPLASLTGFTNPQPESNASVDGGSRDFSFGIALAGEPSDRYRVCWSFSAQAEYVIDVGAFIVHGPDQGLEFECTLGRQCDVVVSGNGLSDVSLLIVVAAAGPACESGNFTAASIPGLTNPQGLGLNPGASINTAAYFLGIPRKAVGFYELCWAAAGASGFTDSSLSPAVHLGSLVIVGPALPSGSAALLQCWVGSECLISISGTGLSFGDRMLVGAACDGQSLANYSGLINPASPLPPADQDMQSATFDLGILHEATLEQLHLCWQSGEWLHVRVVSDGSGAKPHCSWTHNCSWDNATKELCATKLCQAAGFASGRFESSSNDLCMANFSSVSVLHHYSSDTDEYRSGAYFNGTQITAMCDNEAAPGVQYGTLEIYGPVGTGLHTDCSFDAPCNISLTGSSISGSPGRGYDHTDRLLLARSGGEESGVCVGATPVELWHGQANPLAPSSDSEVFYTLGTPLAATFNETMRTLGNYTICWSATGENGTFLMPIGSLTLHDTPCAVPEVPNLDPALPCRSTFTGEATLTLHHAESCVPVCTSDYTSSVASLECNYGQLSPPVHRCLRRCLLEPHVTNGLDHMSCFGTVHGEDCLLRCPPNTTKSGDLECADGFFFHTPVLSQAHLFDVPRCYLGCGGPVVEAGCGRPLLAHGSTCQPSCPAGSSSSVAELSCRDGVLTPESFPCYPSCLEPPNISNAIGLHMCAGLLHGEACQLQCDAHYMATGNPVCDQGIWTPERCLSPCSAPSVEHGGNRSTCQGSGLIVHGGICRPVCMPGYDPEVASSASSEDEVVCYDDPEDWVSVSGASCQTYVALQYCTLSGDYGSAWGGSGAGTFDDWAVNGVSATDACCGCGGGSTRATLLCNDGELTPTFECHEKCMYSPRVEHAYPELLDSCIGTVSGGTCATPCTTGYLKTADLHCADGNWSEAACLPACLEPPEVANAPAQNVSCANVATGAMCTITCNEGYAPSGISVCTDGAWSSVVCLQGCDAPVLAHAMDPSCAEGAHLQHEGLCTPQCENGFGPTESNLTCLHGTLVPSAFACTRSCGEVGGIAHAASLAHCTDMVTGSVCELLCASGFHKTGDLICGGAGWKMHRTWVIVSQSILQVSRSNLLATLPTATDFTLSFGIVLRAPAGQSFQSVLHLTIPGGNCCVRGNRAPAVLLAPTHLEPSGAMLYIYLDPGPGCSRLPLLRIGVKSVIIIRQIGGMLQAIFDGEEVCAKPYEDRLEPSEAASLWAGSPFHEAADAELTNVVYSHEGVEGMMPECEQTSCEQAPPPVPGAETPGSSSCAGRLVGDTCAGFVCPEGSNLTGRFVCGEDGQWHGENGIEVRCSQVRCPALPPVVEFGVAATECANGLWREVCLVQCEAGYESHGGFVCGLDGRWAPLSAAPAPRCTPLPCLDTPRVPYGMTSQACAGLPSGAACAATCWPSRQSLFSYRCEAQVWTEVPVCIPPGLLQAQGADHLAVTSGLMIEPSSELQAVFASTTEWARHLAPAVLRVLDHSLSSQLQTSTRIQILGVVGSSRQTLGSSGARRLQETLRPIAWVVSLVYAAIPQSGSSQDAQDVAATIAGLSDEDVSARLYEELLVVDSAPDVVSVMASEPQLVSLPAQVAEYISSTEFGGWQAALSAEPALSPVPTPTFLAITSTLMPEETTDPLGARLDPDAQTSQDYAGEAAPDDGFISWWLLLSFVPLAFVSGLCLWWRWTRRAKKPATHVSHADTVDFLHCVETYNLESEWDGLTYEDVKRHRESVANQQRQHQLMNGMGHKGHRAPLKSKTSISSNVTGDNDNDQASPSNSRRSKRAVKEHIGMGTQSLQSGMGTQSLQSVGGLDRSMSVLDPKLQRIRSQGTMSETQAHEMRRRRCLPTFLACLRALICGARHRHDNEDMEDEEEEDAAAHPPAAIEGGNAALPVAASASELAGLPPPPTVSGASAPPEPLSPGSAASPRSPGWDRRDAKGKASVGFAEDPVPADETPIDSARSPRSARSARVSSLGLPARRGDVSVRSTRSSRRSRGRTSEAAAAAADLKAQVWTLRQQCPDSTDEDCQEALAEAAYDMAEAADYLIRKTFFDFPGHENIEKDYEPVMSYQELLNRKVHKATLSDAMSTRDSSAGNRVEDVKEVQVKGDVDILIQTSVFSTPVRQNVESREASQREQSGALAETPALAPTAEEQDSGTAPDAAAAEGSTAVGDVAAPVGRQLSNREKPGAGAASEEASSSDDEAAEPSGDDSEASDSTSSPEEMEEVEERGLPCTSRRPVPGDRVMSADGKEYVAENGWRLERGEVAIVTEVDADGDFILQNPRDDVADWEIASKFVYSKATPDPGAAAAQASQHREVRAPHFDPLVNEAVSRARGSELYQEAFKHHGPCQKQDELREEDEEEALRDSQALELSAWPAWACALTERGRSVTAISHV